MKTFDTLKTNSTSLTGQVFYEIENAILTGALAPGDNLTEMKISAQLGVSRTPVREALRQLELEGLVKSVPNKGAVVVGVSEKDIADIYTIRMYIEGLAARWAAENITDEELERMKDVVELQEFYLSRKDPIQIWHLDSRFHEIIYESCRSAPLKHTLSGFHHYILRARELSFKTAGRAVTSVQEHRNILEALQQRDGAAAERLTCEHIKNAKENLMHQFHEME